mgnify:FL=1|tara:strand:+ start:325 stop:2067 length:1743 start_codon:yes stop_codon:yes gene_type:complete
MPFLHKCLNIALLLVAFSSSAWANIQATASVSNNQVFLGDTFILTVEVNDTGSEYQLDTNQLNDNFEVSRPSRSQNTSMINGDITRKITWLLRLKAKKIGTFTIPPFTLGDTVTQAINIEVKEAGEQQQSTPNDTIFIENSVNKSKVYLDQPIILETKIYVSENIIDGDVQAPILEAASIERIVADDKSTQIVRNGVRYQLFTYQYQITPSQAGEVNINSPLLVGSIRKNISVNDWQNRIIAQPINIRGNNVAITVKEMPASYQGDWLISEDVHLIENNNLQQQALFVGDPITRSISLRVASIALEKMPEIKLNYDSSLRYYPDQDDLKQGTLEDMLYSQRTITHAIIADKSGQLILPEIKVPWWNSKTEQQEFATLPAQTLTIKAALRSNNSNKNTTSNASNINSDSSINSNSTDQSSLTAAIQQHKNTTKGEYGQLLIWKISTLVLLLLLILLSFYHLKSRRNDKVNTNKANHVVTDNKQYQQLLNALKQAKPNQVYGNLLRYLQSQQAAITQVQQITTFTGLSEDKKQQLILNLQQLELACSAQTHHWDAQQLLKLIKMHHQVTIASNFNSLNNINP